MKLRVFKDTDQTCLMLARSIKELVERSTGDFNMVLSGGSTPVRLFEIMVNDFSDMDWSRVNFYWSDERCVPYDNPESNFGVALKKLLSPLSIAPANIHAVNTKLEPEEAAIDYAEEIASKVPSCCGLPKFDLIILGMGDDGHTASIFPNRLELLTLPTLCEVAIHPQSKQIRVSLTGQLINNAENIVFLCTGENKAERINDVVCGEKPEYPSTYIKPVDGELTWFIDQKAASKLEC